jgi:hypothetical protein
LETWTVRKNLSRPGARKYSIYIELFCFKVTRPNIILNGNFNLIDLIDFTHWKEEACFFDNSILSSHRNNKKRYGVDFWSSPEISKKEVFAIVTLFDILIGKYQSHTNVSAKRTTFFGAVSNNVDFPSS